jgi:hypothetical protein
VKTEEEGEEKRANQGRKEGGTELQKQNWIT